MNFQLLQTRIIIFKKSNVRSLLSRLRFLGCGCGMNFLRNLDTFADILDTSPNNLDTICRNLDTFFNNLDTSQIHSKFLSIFNKIYYPPHSHSHPPHSHSHPNPSSSISFSQIKNPDLSNQVEARVTLLITLY